MVYSEKKTVQPIQLEVKDKIVNKQNIKNPFSHQLEFTGIYNLYVRLKMYSVPQKIRDWQI